MPKLKHTPALNKNTSTMRTAIGKELLSQEVLSHSDLTCDTAEEFRLSDGPIYGRWLYLPCNKTKTLHIQQLAIARMNSQNYEHAKNVRLLLDSDEEDQEAMKMPTGS